MFQCNHKCLLLFRRNIYIISAFVGTTASKASNGGSESAGTNKLRPKVACLRFLCFDAFHFECVFYHIFIFYNRAMKA